MHFCDVLKMNKKITKLIFASLFILCFGLLPLVNAGDYVTYGDIMAKFQAYFNGGIAVRLIGENEIGFEHVPAMIDGNDGLIWPFFDEMTYRYEDAHGIFFHSIISENDLAWLCYALGITYDPDKLNQECKDMMDRFSQVFVLNGVQLDLIQTPYKRTFIVEVMGSEALWWSSVGVLYKPGELARGTYNLKTWTFVELPNGWVVPIPGYASDITFYII